MWGNAFSHSMRTEKPSMQLLGSILKVQKRKVMLKVIFNTIHSYIVKCIATRCGGTQEVFKKNVIKEL